MAQLGLIPLLSHCPSSVDKSGCWINRIDDPSKNNVGTMMILFYFYLFYSRVSGKYVNELTGKSKCLGC